MESCIIHCWSGPRSLSTATMYSFESRPDVLCLDEPLYASHLKNAPDIYRPYRDELLSKCETDGNKVIKDMHLLITKEKPIIFCKHLAKQLLGIDRKLLLQDSINGVKVKHFFLIREPLKMLASWNVKKDVTSEDCNLNATSLLDLVQLFSELRSSSHKIPLVVDSNLLMNYPKPILLELCKELDIPFFEEQLTWKLGPHICDGLWAKFWYETVHNTTGFNKQEAVDKDGNEILIDRSYKTLSKDHLDLYRECLPLYEILKKHAIGINYLSPGSSCNTLYLPKSSSIDNSETTSCHGKEINFNTLSDDRNRDILVWIGDQLLPRESAKVSVFDSAVQGGDAVWEGLRIYNGKIFKLDEHLNRLIDSSKAMAFKNIPSREFIKTAIFKTLAANEMRDSAHVRLTLTRGAKITSSMNPVFNIFGCNLIVLPEWKSVGGAATYDNVKGVALITSYIRRNSPQFVDSKIHHCNLINNILPKIQANLAGVADALMLDNEGFVSETNACNIFLVKNNQVLTPHADYCLPGVTRATVIKIVRSMGLDMIERRISLSEFHSGDEVFTTGTMGELTPVNLIDGRVIGESKVFEITCQIQQIYRQLTINEGELLPDF